MKKMKAMVLTLCACIVMMGCNNLGKGTAIGAAGGALLGAIVGKVAGNTAVGAAVGTAVGAGAGALIGKHMDKVKAQAEAVQNAQVQSITDANGLQAVQVTFDSGILFQSGKAVLNNAAKTSLSQFANNVLKVNTDCDVAIQGYTDNAGWIIFQLHHLQLVGVVEELVVEELVFEVVEQLVVELVELDQ